MASLATSPLPAADLPSDEAYELSIQSLMWEGKSAEAGRAAHAAGMALLAAGYPSRARLFLEQAIQFQRAALTLGHDETLQSVAALAGLLERAGLHGQAYNWLVQLHEGQTALHGPDAAVTVKSSLQLARLRAGEVAFYAQAVELQHRLLSILRDAHPETPARTLQAHVKIAQLTALKGQWPLAIDWFGRALQQQIALVGEEHGATANLVDSIAETHRLAGSVALALQYYGWALRIRLKVFGSSIVVADTLYNMALLHKRAGTSADAGALTESLGKFTEAADMMAAVKGATDAATLDASHQAARVAALLRATRAPQNDSEV